MVQLSHMTESEIKEQIITQQKNKDFINSTIAEIENLPEEEAHKRLDEYSFCLDKIIKSNYLDESITRRRLKKEIREEKLNNPNIPNHYREAINKAIQELVDSDYIYWIDNKYSLKNGIYIKTIIEFLITNYYDKMQEIFGYISRIDFKSWVCDVFDRMNYKVSRESLKKQIDTLL